jgi:hypothetical protein
MTMNPAISVGVRRLTPTYELGITLVTAKAQSAQREKSDSGLIETL